MIATDIVQALALFEQARALQGEERERFLAQLGLRQPGLLARVRQMLHADSQAHTLLDSGEPAACQPAEPRAHICLGRRFGPYLAVRELGRGGMGVVCLAERADVGARVAIKVVSCDTAAEARVARFERERRLLAQLDHPNIARFLDAGVAEDGVLWLAMEYVEGLPVDAHSDARCLTVAERLALFEQVGEAVAYAHGRQLVHRDIKPSNVLVSEAGVPKLLDFGIAKLLADDDESAALTVDPAVVPMTPAYASPEQVRAEPITAASDVYQLGILLHELLTGRRPLRPGGEPIRHYERAADVPMARPSAVVATAVIPEQVAVRPTSRSARELSALRRATPAQLRRQLSGDLDAIVSTAMRAEPEHRYATAQELVEDVRRYRQGLPIRARPASPAYRAAKLLLRHRVASAVALSLAVLLVLSALLAGHQTRDLAREQARADQVAGVLEDLVLRADPASQRGDAAAARAAMSWVVAQGLTGLRTAPAMWAPLLLTAGDVYRSLGRSDTAMLVWDAIIDAVEPVSPGDSTLLVVLGMQGISLVEAGEFARGLAMLDTMVARARALPARRRRDRAEALYKAAFGRQVAGDEAGARRLNEEALALLAQLSDSGGIVYDRTLLNLGTIANDQGDPAAAERYFREALAIREARDGPRHERSVNALAGLAEALLRRGDLPAADSLSALVLAERRRLYRSANPSLAAALVLRADVETALGRPARALVLGREAETMYRELHGDGHFVVGSAQRAIADALLAAGRPAEALAVMRGAVDRYQRTAGESHPETRRARERLTEMAGTR